MAQGKCILKRWENKNEESSFSAAGLPRAAVFGSAAASNRGTTLQTLATHDASFCSVKNIWDVHHVNLRDQPSVLLWSLGLLCTCFLQTLQQNC